MLQFKTDKFAWPIQSPNHRVPVLTPEGIQVKRAEDVIVGGDVLMNTIGYNQIEKADPHLKAYFLGLWFGDGYSTFEKSKNYRGCYQQLLAEHETEPYRAL